MFCQYKTSENVLLIRSTKVAELSSLPVSHTRPLCLSYCKNLLYIAKLRNNDS